MTAVFQVRVKVPDTCSDRSGRVGGAARSVLENVDDPSDRDAIRIHDIQGRTRVSPSLGRTVTAVPGIVTGVRAYGSKGFWIQDPDPDADPVTSEGIFVYTGSAALTVKTGDSVLVTGM
ncbi:putative extracellular nuclease [Kitasatospora sp. GP82]|nr:putative extracellular nuclease [Kitasatospora sp. GP82]